MPLYRAAQAGLITIRKNTGADIGTRGRVNLIEGTGTTINATDDPGSNEVDVEIISSFTGIPTYTVTGEAADRVIDVQNTSLNELLNVVATLLNDLGVTS